jgi:hypothetical protein
MKLLSPYIFMFIFNFAPALASLWRGNLASEEDFAAALAWMFADRDCRSRSVVCSDEQLADDWPIQMKEQFSRLQHWIAVDFHINSISN